MAALPTALLRRACCAGALGAVCAHSRPPAQQRSRTPASTAGQQQAIAQQPFGRVLSEAQGGQNGGACSGNGHQDRQRQAGPARAQGLLLAEGRRSAGLSAAQPPSLAHVQRWSPGNSWI